MMMLIVSALVRVLLKEESVRSYPSWTAELRRKTQIAHREYVL
jgi:hypothetical protein